MNIWFTSDTHFNHQNIIAYCNRPYASLEEMNEAMISSWNSLVKVGDKVYHLGDFAMGKKSLHSSFGMRLNGYKILIRGNHDHKDEHMKSCGFAEIHKSLRLDIAGLTFFMSHIPAPDDDPYTDRSYPDGLKFGLESCSLRLCGHVHNAFLRKGNTVNVGVDVWNYRPVHLDELVKLHSSQ